MGVGRASSGDASASIGGLLVIGYLAYQFWNMEPRRKNHGVGRCGLLRLQPFSGSIPKVVVIVSAITAYAGDQAQNDEVVG